MERRIPARAFIGEDCHTDFLSVATTDPTHAKKPKAPSGEAIQKAVVTSNWRQVRMPTNKYMPGKKIQPSIPSARGLDSSCFALCNLFGASLLFFGSKI